MSGPNFSKLALKASKRPKNSDITDKIHILMDGFLLKNNKQIGFMMFNSLFHSSIQPYNFIVLPLSVEIIVIVIHSYSQPGIVQAFCKFKSRFGPDKARPFPGRVEGRKTMCAKFLSNLACPN